MGEAATMLGGEYTIHTVGERVGSLARELERGASRFDMAGVTDFDTAGMQLLAAARNTVRARGQAFAIEEPSAAVRAVLASYGLDCQLEPIQA